VIKVSQDSTGHVRTLTTYPARSLLALGLALLAACARTPPPGREGAATTPVPRQRQAASPTSATPDSGGVQALPPAATLEEVRSAVARVYRGAVVVEAGGATPFVVGDFNGDGSEDLAVVVRPGAGKIPEVNGEYASWIVEDPRKVVAPEVRGDVKVLAKKPEPVRVRQGELLLAVIHGYRERGWRDPLASQTYLLRGAAGVEMKAQPAADILGAGADEVKLPQPHGDVIRERLAGAGGFIYWTGTKYAWAGAVVSR
jgi:hypothetical protein